MRYVRVKVKRDTLTTYSRSLPEWEIPVLEYIFEAGNIEREEVFEQVAAGYPDAGLEFDRLVRAYGSDPENGIPHVASVYGNGGIGIRALKREIDAASAADAAATKAAKAQPKRRKPVAEVKDFELDPLLA